MMDQGKINSNSWIFVSKNSVSTLLQVKKFISEKIGDNDKVDLYIRHNYSKLLIDELKELIVKGSELSTISAYKVIVIEGADEMDTRTANVLLKVLEEPIESTIWILCATNYYSLLPTIRSRCQAVFLNNLTDEEIKNKLVNWGYGNNNRAEQIAKISLGNILFAFLYTISEKNFEHRQKIMKMLLESNSAFYSTQIASLVDKFVIENSNSAEDYLSNEQAKDFYEKHVLNNKTEDAEELKLLFSNFFIMGEQEENKNLVEKRLARIKHNYYTFYLFVILSLLKDAINLKINSEAELINLDFKDDIIGFSNKKSYENLIYSYEKIYTALNDLPSNVNKTLMLESVISQVL